MNNDIGYVQSWVECQMIRGKYFFTKKDVLSYKSDISPESVERSLRRLTTKKIIVSPWQNFYVIVPTEYKLRGKVPPEFYINRLMQFLEREYYVSHLTAAGLNGASHQQAMVFQVVISGAALRSGVKCGTKIQFTQKQQLPVNFIQKIKTQSGYMNIASAELTAMDLVAYESKVGGLSRVAEVLIELCERTSWSEDRSSLLEFFSIATIQRLGYLLELIGEIAQADALWTLAKQSSRTMRKMPLKQNLPYNETMPMDNRWKIIVNYKLEIDEI